VANLKSNQDAYIGDNLQPHLENDGQNLGRVNGERLSGGTMKGFIAWGDIRRAGRNGIGALPAITGEAVKVSELVHGPASWSTVKKF
jgi:hypothetical protein